MHSLTHFAVSNVFSKKKKKAYDTIITQHTCLPMIPYILGYWYQLENLSIFQSTSIRKVLSFFPPTTKKEIKLFSLIIAPRYIESKSFNLFNNNMKVPAFVSTCSLAEPSTVVLCMATTPSNASELPSRRAFMTRGVSASFTAAATGIFVNFDGHVDGCKCTNCAQNSDHEEGCGCSNCASEDFHPFACQCHNCMSFGPLSAAAYDRDVGDSNRSPETYAQNIQVRCLDCFFFFMNHYAWLEFWHLISLIINKARATNARLEKSGFKLDSKEEEQARLSEAFASISYDQASSSKYPKSTGKGYGNQKSDATSSK